MDSDDALVGRLLSRREAIALLAAAGGAWAGWGTAGARPPAPPGMCVARPRLEEGPYFVDERLNRADIRSDPADGSVRAGVPLQLAIHVSRMASTACTPLAGVLVDVWHCDADGIYSDVRDPSFDTTGKKFLRGSQRTDAAGTARFTTIYPGWYHGRTVHIHFKLRGPATDGRSFDFTSQLFFDDAFTDRVFAQPPYASRGPRTVRNERDGIYREGGSQLVLAVTPDGPGYAAAFNIGLQGV